MKKKEMKALDKRTVIKKIGKRMVMVGCVSLLLLGGASKGLTQKDPGSSSTAKSAIKQVPEFIDINIQKSCPDLDGLKKDKKSVSHFSHEAHIKYLSNDSKEFVCAKCHKGVKKQEELLKGDKCKRLAAELEEVGGPQNLQKYFHGTCLKCHKELKKENKTTGPVSCKGCHSRKGGKK